MTRTTKRILCALTAAVLVSSALPNESSRFLHPAHTIRADAATGGKDITATGSCGAVRRGTISFGRWTKTAS